VTRTLHRASAWSGRGLARWPVRSWPCLCPGFPRSCPSKRLTNEPDRLVGGTRRPRSIGTVREVGFEDRLENQSEGALHHAVPDRGDRDRADPASFLRNLSPPVRSGSIRAVTELRDEILEESFATRCLDLRKRLPVGPGCAALALRFQVRRFERGALHDMHAQALEPVRGRRFRPVAYPRSQLLQVDGGLYHPALASL